MSEHAKRSGPRPAHAEEFDEETQEAVPGTKQSASKTRQAATQGTSGSAKLLSMVGLKKSSKLSKSSKSPEKATSRKSTTKSTKKPNIKIDTNVESQQEASRISLSGGAPPPFRRMSSHHTTRVDATGIHHTIPVRISQQGRAPAPRPISVHGSVPGHPFPLVYTSTPVINPPYMPIPPPPQQPLYQHPQHPTAYITPTPTSPSRQTAYPFPPTLPPQYIPQLEQPPWDSPYQHYIPPPAPAPALSRRFSIAGHPPPVIDYPMVPHRSAIQSPYEQSRPPSAYHVPHGSYGVDERAMIMNDHEAYYQRRREEERLAMPPPPVPQRPLLKHIVTAPQSTRRSNRVSLESIPRRPTSSRHDSFSSQREDKAPLMERSSSSRNGVSRTIPSSPDSPRKSRPGSYHAGLESARRQSLTTEAVRRVDSMTKSTKPKTSEAGSKTSRKLGEPKKRPEPHHQVSSEAVHVEVDPGCAATVTRDATGYSVRVRTTEEQSSRAGRQAERDDADKRRYSASSRRESSGMIEALPRSITTHRASSSHPTTRRPRIEQVVPESVTRRITDYKIRDLDETAVEEDDYSEPETRKKRSEKLTGQRVQRLKKTSESRQSSRDNRSVRSSKSTRSTTSSRRGPHMDGEFF